MAAAGGRPDRKGRDRKKRCNNVVNKGAFPDD